MTAPTALRPIFRTLPLGLATLTLSLCLTGLAQAQSKEELQAAYKKPLDEQGYRPTISEQGNILFKAEGRSYVIYIDEKDPKFFRLVLSFQAPTETTDEHTAKRIKALNDATRTTKTIKAYLGETGSANFAVEEFQSTPGDATANLPRMIRAMQAAYSKYQQNSSK